ncbi:phenazine biosynthesis-like protein [Trematosphaeria pertusa]|uniref:Phenazine biosynthesis-like protein n=1 Tax=Trematosphaeria pertusa TaxID=390896 RepID=A0A6A6IYJ6_9PLEO|nr:phenazine biosynthesis-like protein [Trematosphaeria pertusa]KAF2254992.1 phenazine biosynthesis-like protein [Trematosphaeria pertusa]
MHFLFTTLDVFTTTRYAGNPLAVVRVPSSLRAQLTEEKKLKIAKEFNLSEITFLHEPDNGEDTAEYDIFTTASRMTFAGHPTIGTAIYVATTPAKAYEGVKKLRTLAGVVPFVYDGETRTARVNIPHDVHIHRARLPHPFPALETNPSGEATVPLVSIVKGMAFNLVPMANLDALALPAQGLLPIAKLYAGEHLDPGSGWDIGYTGTFYYVDLGSDAEHADTRLLRTRSIGSREDPGTGSASGALCCYLALQEGKEGVRKFHLTQGVEMGRRCDIFVEVVVMEGGKEIEELRLSGSAVEVMEGMVFVD